MKTHRPFITFVFCTNSERHLREFSDGLLQLLQNLRRLMPTIDTELLVICPDPLAMRNQIQELRPSIPARALAVEWGNRGDARNHGFASAAGEWVYFLDQDVRFDSENLPTVARALTNVASYGPAVHLLTGPYRSNRECSFWGCSYNWLSNLWLWHSPTGLRALAGNLLLRKSAFATVPFDPARNAGGEELELCERIGRKGGQGIIDRDLASIHLADHTLRRFWQRLLGHERIKRRLPYSSKRTRVGVAVLREIALFPKGWPALAVWAVVNAWSAIEQRAQFKKDRWIAVHPIEKP